MKKIVGLVLVLVLGVGIFSGCDGQNQQQQSVEPTGTMISSSEQQDNSISTASPSASASISPTPSASPSASSTASKSNGYGVDGRNGKDGKNGKDGQTPYIGSNGNWWIGNKDTGVSATGQGTGGSMGTSIADIPVGTKFPCYPNKEFDWVDEESGKTIHVTSINVELTAKNDFDAWAENPDLRNTYSFYSPYTVTASISGFVVDADSGTVEIVLKSNDNGFAQASSTINNVNNDGTFQVEVAFNNLTRVVDIWFGRAVVYKDIPTPTPTPEPTPTPNPSPNPDSVEAFIDVAMKQIGKQYQLGAKGPDEFDASGLVYYALRESGGEIGYMTSGGWANSGYPTIDSINDLQRGDIVCLNGHVAIYLGDGQILDASSALGQVVTREMGAYFQNNFICGKRPL